ncbi:MAG: hypothetical protein E7B11_15210 [Clostridiales bacterium]|nr:hypothetical protein [Clostridiales bacterium]MDU3241911.1 hypothetical protein [Clostridiales bacterium]
MHLVEIFMDEFYKENSALNALVRCDKVLRRRMRGISEVEECERYFFYVGDNGEILAPSEKYVELMGFWELYRENVSEKDIEAAKNYWIMKMLYESSCTEAIWENYNSKAKLTEQQLKNLDKLVNEIYEPISKKYLVLLRGEEVTYRVWKITNLDRFDDEVLFAERAHVENQIMQMFRLGGIVAWVVGREGLTPKRIYGYKVFGEQCETCSREYLETLRKVIFVNDELTEMAKGKGDLPGHP